MDQQAIKIKQQYLRDHIPEEYHQQFGIFCLDQAGNQDIQSWSMQYVKELVVKFNSTKIYQVQQTQQANLHQRSFHIYQTAEPQQAQNLSEQIRKQAMQQQQVQKRKQIEEQRQVYPQMKKPNKNQKSKSTNKTKQISQPKRSAVDLLDYVFEKVQKEQHSPPTNNNQKIQYNFNTQNIQSSFFDSNNFWAPTRTSKKQQQTKSQSSQNFKYLEDSFFNEFINSTINQKQQKNNKIEEKNINDSYLKGQNEKKQKMPSPYQKKQQIQVVEIKNKQHHGIRIKEVKQLNKGELSQRQRKICNKVTYQGITIFKQRFEDSVPCFKSSIRAALSHPELSITIQKHQIIHKSFFVPDYVMYTLKIIPADIECKRNYEDFTKLRNAFARVYPGIQLPYLQKNSWLSETNADFIKKQKLMLQYFLADVVYNKQLRNSRIFQDFLTLQQHKKIKRKFQQYDKMQQLTCIEQLCLLQGKVDVKITQQNRIYQEKAQKFVTTMEQLLERHKKLAQTLAYQYQCIMVTLTSLADLMKQSDQSVKNFNNRVTINQIQTLSEAFQTFNKVYNQKYIQNKFQADILNQKILPFLKYETCNLDTIKQLLSSSNQMTKRYLRRIETQVNSSNQPYLSEKLKHFKSGILQQSKNILIFKYQIGFINNQACSEVQRFFDLMGTKFSKRCNYIAQKNLILLAKGDDFWKSIIAT